MASDEYEQQVANNQLEMFILDVLRYDIEPISSIIQLLNDRSGVGWRDYWPHDFREEEIIPALKRLAERGLIEVLRESEDRAELVPAHTSVNIQEDIGMLWFMLSEDGWSEWNKWEPRNED